MQTSVSKDMQSAYDKQYASGANAWREAGAFYKANHILELCNRNNIAPKKILEVGAGDGSILKYLDAAGFCPEMHALELSQSGTEAIKSRAIPSVKSAQQFDGYKVPFADRSFDLVILSHVLEHVEHERVLLRELKRVAEYSAIEVPLDFSWTVDQRVDHFLSYGHINIYTPPLLRFLLKAEGFEVIDDCCNLTGLDLRRHQFFVFQKNPKTPENEQLVEQKQINALAEFNALPKAQREQRANDFTVLVKNSGIANKIMTS